VGGGGRQPLVQPVQDRVPLTRTRRADGLPRATAGVLLLLLLLKHAPLVLLLLQTTHLYTQSTTGRGEGANSQGLHTQCRPQAATPIAPMAMLDRPLSVPHVS
jgi:hypothetical protein